MHQPISSQTAVPPSSSQPHFYNNAAAAQPGPPTYTPPGILLQQPAAVPANDNNLMPPPPVDQNPLTQFMKMMQYMAAHLPQPATGAAARAQKQRWLKHWRSFVFTRFRSRLGWMIVAAFCTRPVCMAGQSVSFSHTGWMPGRNMV